MNVVVEARRGVRLVVRHIASWLNHVTKGTLRPNAVTITGMVMHLPIALLIAADKLPLAGVLLVVFGLFDTLDGELARLQHRASEAGMLLDASGDRIKEVLLYSGVAYLLSMSDYRTWTWLAVAACGSSITVSYVKAKGEAVLAAKHKSQNHRKSNSFDKPGLVPFEVRMFILVVGLLSSHIIIATMIIALTATYTILERLMFIIRKL